MADLKRIKDPARLHSGPAVAPAASAAVFGVTAREEGQKSAEEREEERVKRQLFEKHDFAAYDLLGRY